MGFDTATAWYMTTDVEKISTRTKHLLQLLVDASLDDGLGGGICLDSRFGTLFKTHFNVVLSKLNKTIDRFPYEECREAFASSIADMEELASPTKSSCMTANELLDSRVSTASSCLTIPLTLSWTPLHQFIPDIFAVQGLHQSPGIITTTNSNIETDSGPNLEEMC